MTPRIVRDARGQHKPRLSALRYSEAMHHRSNFAPAVVALAAWAWCAPALGAGYECGRTPAAGHELEAELALARGSWARAGLAAACAALASDDPEVAERATRIAFDNVQWQAAVRAASRWLELEPGREEARRYLATSLLRLHRTEEAARQFGIVLDEAYAERAQGYLALLAILDGEANDTGAARIMDRMAAGDSGLAEAHYAASVLWQRAENGERALAAARRALALKPDWRQAGLAEARALLAMGRTDEGLARARALAADGDALSQLNLAWFLAGAGREDEAQALFEDLRRSGTAVPQALEGLGALGYTQRDYESARATFTELAQQGQGETALAYLGLIALRQGDEPLALRYLERVDAGPRATSSQLEAARLLEKRGAPLRAELLLDDYLAASPEAARDVVVRRANQLADAGHGDAALAIVDRAIRLYPDDDDLRLSRGFLLERLDRVPEAVAAMRDVLKRRPDDPTAQNSLGYTLVDRTRRTAEGLALVERAIEAKPDSYAIIDSVGWALYRAGRATEGLAWLERAWERSEDPEVAAHLGEVLWSLGRRDEAVELWNGALEEAPENRTLQRTLERHPR